MVSFGRYGFGSVWKHSPKIGLVGCVSRSDNFFYLFLSSFKGSNFGREYQEEVVIKSRTKQNTYYGEKRALKASKTRMKVNSAV